MTLAMISVNFVRSKRWKSIWQRNWTLPDWRQTISCIRLNDDDDDDADDEDDEDDEDEDCKTAVCKQKFLEWPPKELRNRRNQF